MAAFSSKMPSRAEGMDHSVTNLNSLSEKPKSSDSRLSCGQVKREGISVSDMPRYPEVAWAFPPMCHGPYNFGGFSLRASQKDDADPKEMYVTGKFSSIKTLIATPTSPSSH